MRLFIWPPENFPNVKDRKITRMRVLVPKMSDCTQHILQDYQIVTKKMAS